MAHFYFHLRHGPTLIPDDQGQDLPDAAAARREALLSAREILSSAILWAEADPIDAVAIFDSSGDEIDIVMLREVLPTRFQK